MGGFVFWVECPVGETAFPDVGLSPSSVMDLAGRKISVVDSNDVFRKRGGPYVAAISEAREAFV